MEGTHVVDMGDEFGICDQLTTEALENTPEDQT